MDQDDTTGAGSPIPRSLVADTAEHESIDENDLVEALATIHADLVDGADAIHEYYVHGDEEHPPPIEANRGLAEVLFVDPSQWDQLATRLGLPAAIRDAARSVHADYARDLGADEDLLAERDALVMPSNLVASLVRAGLSRRQAAVQVLRSNGHTQAAIGEFLGLETGTVKSHCYRIDEKVTQAKRLLELVEE